MSPQTIKFLTFLQPNYITSIVEIIFLILIWWIANNIATLKLN